MTTTVLNDRLRVVRAEIARKSQVREVVTAQLNMLIGREAELLELLARVDVAEDVTGVPV